MRVRIIEPMHQAVRKRRTCAYARVSTYKNLQGESLENQMTYYENLIGSNPDYEYIGMFADRGITGTTDNRPEFQRMLQLCRQGEIDFIITKSISRFARNTAVMLETVRELKDIGVEVRFEKENINTLSGDGELMLTVLSSFAEEESRSISENVKWRIRRDYQSGNVFINTDRFLGYDKDENGNLVINEEEAAVVRRIFNLYVGGMGCKKIAKTLAQEGIKTFSCRDKWDNSSIINILKNEKYQGDVLCQKTYVSNHRSQRSVINRGELNQYYISDNHPAIVTREVWQKAQEIRAQNKSRKGITNNPKSKNPYTGLLFCSKCGASLWRGSWHSNSPNRKYVWQCSNYVKNGKGACTGTIVEEQELAKVNIYGETIVKVVKKDGKKHYSYSSKIRQI
ncbi:MAG: recombinase family protein [Deltaproteobacteria bacterium]